MTCISCEGTFVPCDDCVDEIFGEIDHLDTRPDDRRQRAWELRVKHRAESAFYWQHLDQVADSNPTLAQLQFAMRVATSSSHAARKSFCWLLRWDALVLKRQRLGLESELPCSLTLPTV